MKRRLLLPLSLIVATLTATTFAADNLPQASVDEAFDIEPPELIPNRSDEPLKDPATTQASPRNDPERLEREVEIARKGEADATRFFKMGVLSKLEVEQLSLRVVRLQSELANARVTFLKEQMAAQQQQLAAGAISKADLSQTEAALVVATDAARLATDAWHKAQLEAAERNVERQRKLLLAGSGRKSELARAEQKLAELKAAKN